MKTLVLSALLVASAPSYAWGDREQGILTGIFIGALINKAQQPQPPQVQVVPIQLPVCGYNVYCQPIPQPPVCRSYPQVDYYGRITHYITYCTPQ